VTTGPSGYLDRWPLSPTTRWGARLRDGNIKTDRGMMFGKEMGCLLHLDSMSMIVE